jgi:hypothetical protein
MVRFGEAGRIGNGEKDGNKSKDEKNQHRV